MGTQAVARPLFWYTLRLLTTQQFQRAAAMICACEVVRKLNADEWGDEPFSLGLGARVRRLIIWILIPRGR